MTNELIFFVHVAFLSALALAALRMGKEALVALICLQSILANLFVTKQMTLFGLNATASDAYTIGSVIGLNFLQEYFGKDIAKKTIWINLVMLALYITASQIHLAYMPNAFDSMHEHCRALLEVMPRIVISSVIVFFIVQQIDYLLYGALKKRFQDRFLVTRNIISIGLCQLLDTVLFTVFGLYGIADNVHEIIFVSYTIKLCALALAMPCIALSKYVMRFKSYNV